MRRLLRSGRWVARLAIAGAALLPSASTIRAQTLATEAARVIEDMEIAAGASLEITSSAVTRLPTFLSSPPDGAIPVWAPASDSARERALSFLDAYGPAFGLRGREDARVLRESARDEVSMEHVRLQQLFYGVPVSGGQLTIHLRGAAVVAVHAKTLPVENLARLNLTPRLGPSEATSIVARMVEKHHGKLPTSFTGPRLEIFNRGLLEGVESPTRLTWFIEAAGERFHRLIWVDAHRGAVLLEFNQFPTARMREIYDAGETGAIPGTLVRSEGDPPTLDPDADFAYDYAGDTYDYFLAEHGLDSYDGAGAALVATVHFCISATCPWPNAGWSPLHQQTVFGTGFPAADDVVAHELTHGVTEHSADLYYYMQSGALNESFSDMFGETIDLTNTGGTDGPAFDWLIGEDLPGGAIRDMLVPSNFGHPGKMSDAQFVCEDPGSDGGGVHSNSGVPNHAYALMVDGGSFNGFDVTGIGLTRAGKIQYRTLEQYLVSASDFLGYYNAAQQACSDLVDTAGISLSTCNEVKKALDAVEMSDPWPCLPPQPSIPELCASGASPIDLWFDDLEDTASTSWSPSAMVGSNHWTSCAGSSGLYCSDFATSGTHHFYGEDWDQRADSAVEMTLDVSLPSRPARMQFDHSYGFENSGASYRDGGVLEYSIDGGSTWGDAGALISAGADYSATIGASSDNPLGGRSAFVGDSFGYTATQLDLTSLSGQSVRFRFRIGTDSTVGDRGWFLDDVRLFYCNTPPNTPSSPVPSDGAIDVPVSADLSWSGGDPDPGDSARYTVYLEADNPNPSVAVCLDLSTTTCDPGVLAHGTSYFWRVDAVDGDGETATGPVWQFTTEPLRFTLSVSKSGTGSGTVTSNPAGIDCGADCSEPYAYGTVVTLTAAADPGSAFVGWSGDPDCADGIVTIDAAKSCTADFDPWNLDLQEPGGVNGTVVYEACGWIRASNFPIVGGGDVTFRAGEFVALGDGFSVGENAHFRVEIRKPAGCP